MLETIWFLGIIAFFIYDYTIGVGIEDNGSLLYYGLAVFWFLSAPILLLKWLKERYLDKKSFVEKS